ncbi:MAG: precorrin-6y C5,15-methyltransferase (decarboxylating) subunit CbiE, partial [Gemmataceae bacterium]
MSGERQTLVVVGIGADGAAGLSPEARAHVARAELLAGGKRQLDYFLDFAGPRVVLEGDLRQAIAQLQANRTQRCVVLASGDPLYFGIGKLLLEHFEGAELQFVPHVSSVQLAFARIKQSWHDARVVSLHGRPLDALRAALAEDAGKIALFTDAHNTPAAIARVLRENDRDFTLWVCENLGGPEERVRSVPRDEVERGPC